MTNKDKAKKLAEEYFPISDWDADEITSEYNQNDCKQAVLAMAEWKDQQFKEYLKKKLESIRDCYQKSKTEYKKDYCSTQMVVIAEIINEFFEE